MANESSNSRPSVNSKTPSRGSTPNQQATRAPLSQQRKVQHVPSQPPATNAWSSAARTANSVMGTAKAQPPPVAAASQAGNKANTAVQASGGNATVRDHAPANDFNAKEVREFMKKGTFIIRYLPPRRLRHTGNARSWCKTPRSGFASFRARRQVELC